MRTIKFKKPAGVLAATVILATATPATAAPPWIVTVGSQTSGQVAFSAYTKSPIQFTVRSGANVVAMSCGAGAAAGSFYPGSYSTGLRVGQIEGSAWSKCVGPSLNMNVYQNMNSKRPINITGLSGPSWAGYINNVNANVQSKPIGVCAFTLTGRINLSFNTAQVAGNNNFTQTINFNQPDTSTNLTVSGVTGCLGLVANGDQAGLTGSFKVHNSVGLVGIA